MNLCYIYVLSYFSKYLKYKVSDKCPNPWVNNPNSLHILVVSCEHNAELLVVGAAEGRKSNKGEIQANIWESGPQIIGEK